MPSSSLQTQQSHSVSSPCPGGPFPAPVPDSFPERMIVVAAAVVVGVSVLSFPLGDLDDLVARPSAIKNFNMCTGLCNAYFVSEFSKMKKNR